MTTKDDLMQDESRPLRVCDLCGQVDRDPRHSDTATTAEDRYQQPAQEVVDRLIDTAPKDQRAALLASLMDRTSFDHHIDCCAANGCPLPADDPNSCTAKVSGAKGKTGKALADYLDKYVRQVQRDAGNDGEDA